MVALETAINDAMTIPELKAQCRAWHLKLSGNKSDLKQVRALLLLHERKRSKQGMTDPLNEALARASTSPTAVG